MNKKGNPNFDQVRNRDTAQATKAALEKLDERTREVYVHIREIMSKGSRTNTAIAYQLNLKGIPCLRGGRQWDATRVRNLMNRVGKLSHISPKGQISLDDFM